MPLRGSGKLFHTLIGRALRMPTVKTAPFAHHPEPCESNHWPGTSTSYRASPPAFIPSGATNRLGKPSPGLKRDWSMGLRPRPFHTPWSASTLTGPGLRRVLSSSANFPAIQKRSTGSVRSLSFPIAEGEGLDLRLQTCWPGTRLGTASATCSFTRLISKTCTAASVGRSLVKKSCTTSGFSSWSSRQARIRPAAMRTDSFRFPQKSELPGERALHAGIWSPEARNRIQCSLGCCSSVTALHTMPC